MFNLCPVIVQLEMTLFCLNIFLPFSSFLFLSLPFSSASLDRTKRIYSQEASEPIFRGRKLILNYTDGSPCPSSSDKAVLPRKIVDDDDDDDDNDKKKHQKPKPGEHGKSSERRKSTVMSFLCDRDLSNPAATISFVGTMDSCSYFFEVRSAAACGGIAANTESGVGPVGVFGIM